MYLFYNGFSILFLQRCLTDEEARARLVGRELSYMADQINPKISYQAYEAVLLQVITFPISQAGYHVMPVQAFRQALELMRRQTSFSTYQSILDMLFYGRKMFSHFLINFEGDDIDGLKLIDQFVDFFNIHCLPWIRSHGGWVSDSVINCITLTLVCMS